MTAAAWAVTVLVQITVVIGLAALFAWPARRRPAVRHAVWLAALVCVLLSPVLAAVAELAGMHVTIPVLTPDAPDVIARARMARPESAKGVMATVERRSSPTQGVPPHSDASPEPKSAVAVIPADPVYSLPNTGTIDRGQLAVNVALSVWLLGTLVLLGRLLLGVRTVARLRRMARPIDPALIALVADDVCQSFGGSLPAVAEAPAVAVPLALGVIRPVVLLPDGLAAALPAAQLRDILIHEAAHLRRRDPLVGLLQRLAAALIWPHPLVHWLNRRLARAREEVCDNYVLGRGRPADYARTLLNLAERLGPPRPVPALALLDADWRLEHRIAGLLAPGRMTMTRTNRWLRAGMAGVLLAAGLTAAAVRLGAAVPPAVDPSKVSVTGIVVDEAGQPVGGAVVSSPRERPDDATRKTTTGADGRFQLVLDQPELNYDAILAATPDGSQQGIYNVESSVRSKSAAEVRLTLRPARAVTVRVVDAQGVAVPSATIAALSAYTSGVITRMETDGTGVAVLRVPSDAQIWHVVAAKRGVGLDYFENYQAWPPSTEMPPLPAEIKLSLSGARTVRVKIADSADRPLPDIELTPWSPAKPGKLYAVNLSGGPLGSALAVRSDAQGIATFDWLPTELRGDVAFLTRSKEYHQPSRIEYDLNQPDVMAVGKVYRNARVSGKVMRPDGQPAAGVLVEAEGCGETNYYCRTMARTAADGTYSLTLAPMQSYIIAVTDSDWAAPAITGLRIAEGATHAGLDFRLERGSLIQGRVTAGTPPQPIAGYSVGIIQLGAKVNFGGKGWGDRRETLHRHTTAGLDGRYSFRIGPGQYQVYSDRPAERDELTVTGEATVTKDFHLPRLPRGPITGIVRNADGTPAPGASLFGQSDAVRGASLHTTTDAQGRFKVDRSHEPMLLYAYSADGTQAGILAIGADDDSAAISLKPAATATGRVVGSDGKPRVGLSLQASVFWTSEGVPVGFYRRLTSDAAGRFVVAGLPPGARCFVYPPVAMLDGCFMVAPGGKADNRAAHVFEVTGVAPIQLGDIKAP